MYVGILLVFVDLIIVTEDLLKVYRCGTGQINNVCRFSAFTVSIDAKFSVFMQLRKHKKSVKNELNLPIIKGTVYRDGSS